MDEEKTIYDESGEIKKLIWMDLARYLDRHAVKFSRIIPKKQEIEYSFGRKAPAELDECLKKKEKSFSESLINAVDAHGYTDPQVYGRAKISRQLFNKIKNDDLYHPTKETAVCLILALHPGIEEAKKLLKTAGYALSKSTQSDLIIRYCIEHGIYSVPEVDDLLKMYRQRPLCADNREELQ